MHYLTNLEITNSIKQFDFTKRSVVNMNSVLDSERFEDMDSQLIFDYLLNQMEMVSFPDYFKRFLFEKLSVENLSDKEYAALVKENFVANKAPRSFHKNGKFKVKNWLRGEDISRDTIFLLGFGLRMNDEEVSEFLTKVLLEQDFNFCDRRETVFWHCFHNDLPYVKALELLDSPRIDTDLDFWNKVQDNLPFYLSNEKMLRQYISCPFTENTVIDEFNSLYKRALIAASKISGSMTPSDIENILCCGIPRNKQGNMETMKQSKMALQFKNKRISRQRLSSILKGKVKISRFDIITLLFLVYSIEIEPDWPTERYLLFVDEINAILQRCNMIGIYPVNPYESFVLMCLLAEEPLTVYSDIWEMSYEE